MWIFSSINPENLAALFHIIDYIYFLKKQKQNKTKNSNKTCIKFPFFFLILKFYFNVDSHEWILGPILP